MIWLEIQIFALVVLLTNEGNCTAVSPVNASPQRSMENKNTGCETNPSDDSELKKSDKRNLPKVCKNEFIPSEAKNSQDKTPLPFEIRFSPYYENKKVAVEIKISEVESKSEDEDTNRGRTLLNFFVKVHGQHFGRFSEALWQREYCCQDGSVRTIIQPYVGKKFFIFGLASAKAFWTYEIDKKAKEANYIEFDYVAVSDNGDYWEGKSRKISIKE